MLLDARSATTTHPPLSKVHLRVFVFCRGFFPRGLSLHPPIGSRLSVSICAGGYACWFGEFAVKGNIIMTGTFGGKLASDPETDLGQELQVSCQTCPSLSILIAPLYSFAQTTRCVLFSQKRGVWGFRGVLFQPLNIFLQKKLKVFRT